MEVDWKCTTCGEGSTDAHLCDPTAGKELVDCPYCNAKDVSPRHVCKAKIGYLAHVCINCGRVSDKRERLCNPEPLKEVTKEKWMVIPARGTAVLTCQNCDQPVQKPGHICDPILPYTCKYCGAEVENSRHMCAEIIRQAKYTCKLCGRVGVEETDLCTSWELK